MKKVAMIGVGKLGQDCAEVMADAGYDVVGYDVAHRTPAFPMRDTIEEAVKDRDFIFIAAPTPHNPIYGGETPTSHLPNKDFDYTIVTDILNEVNKHVNKSQLVVLISTVLPGTVRNILEPCITNARFIYNPYLIAMGTVKWDMVNPEMVIIGTEDGSLTGDASELIDFYKVFMQNDPRYEVGTWDEAESIKIFYNTFISTKLALVNMVQDVAETNGNINVDVVTQALAKSTHRIMGPAYMKAGLGDAGACHPRDNIALRYLADRLDLGYDLFDSIMTAREVQAERMALRCLQNGRNVTIIGKAYKPCVPYTNGSASMLVGYYIEKHGGNLNYYDPNTDDHDMREDWTHVYLIGYWESWVEHLQFKDPSVVVIDPWRKITSNQHSGEIIHYGDTRLKHDYKVPDTTIETMLRQVIEMFPNIRQYENSIHLIDATINFETMFVRRPTEDIVKEIREAYKNGKRKFMFFAATEAFMPHVQGKIQRIANIVDDILPEEDIIVVTGVIDADKVYDKLIDKNGWNKKVSLLNCHFFNYITTTYANGYEYIGGYDVRFRGKIFTCFNKVNREHRLTLLERMLYENLVNNAWYSFEGDTDFKEKIPELHDQKFPLIKQNSEMFPLRLNITEHRHNPVDIQDDDLQYYRDSYFSVITETLFYSKDRPDQAHRPFVEDSLFLTEKTYRCFALLHPFILMARPYSLRELRRQGYKTFSPFIDEAYDTIENDDLRFEAIVKEIKRLNNFTGGDWEVWQSGIKEIVEFNQQHFHDNKNFAITDNYETLFNNIISTPVVNKPIVQKPIEPFVQSIPESIPVVQSPIVEDLPLPNLDLSSVKPVTMLPEIRQDELDWSKKSHTYDNGFLLEYPTHMDGGGFEIKDELYSLIERTGKEHYKRALEWCSGVGPLGYDLLDRNKVDTVAFVDKHSPSIKSCLANATANKIAEKVTAYVSDKIMQIPSEERFDLVVANPPHSGDRQAFIESLEHLNCVDNTCRLIVDEGYEALQDFYENIKDYLNPNADIYITTGSNQEHYIDWATKGGLKFLGFCPMISNPHCGIYHFKV
jgi:UDPglucose 6-dehydrogenase